MRLTMRRPGSREASFYYQGRMSVMIERIEEEVVEVSEELSDEALDRAEGATYTCGNSRQ